MTDLMCLVSWHMGGSYLVASTNEDYRFLVLSMPSDLPRSMANTSPLPKDAICLNITGKQQ